MKREWRTIKGYEGLYEISNYGEVKTLHTMYSHPHNKSALKTNKYGEYDGITLCKNGKVKRFLVHRLVAQAFIPNPKKLPQVNHKDENKHNNRADNLEWITAKDNLRYSGVQDKLLRAAHEANKKKVRMFTKEGKYIKTFESITTAAKAIGSFQQNVSVCCQDWSKTTKGYKFKYKEN